MKLKLIEKREIVEGVWNFSFDIKKKSFLFKAGQYIRLVLPPLDVEDTKGPARLFSVCSSPNNREELNITFRLSESGYKKTLFNMQIGAEAEFEGPWGSFVLPDSAEKPIVFIAGGTGITPFLSMMRFTTEEKLPHHINLLYASRDKNNIAYFSELRELAKQNLKLKINFIAGQIDEKLIRKNSPKNFDALFYISGPPGMVDYIRGLLQNNKAPDENIYYEEWSNLDFLSQPIKNMFDASTDAIFLTDLLGIIKYVNPAWEKLSGWKAEKVVEKCTPRIQKSGRQGPEYYKKIWDYHINGKTYKHDVTNKRKDGTLYEIDHLYLPLFSAAKKIVGFAAFQREISEEKLREKAKYERVIRNSSDGFWLVSEDGRLLDVNDAYCEMSGYGREELLKMGISDLEADETTAEIKKQINEITKKGNIRFERRHRTKAGQIINVEINATHLPEDRGKFYTFIRDITEIKKIREEKESIAKFPEENPYPVFRAQKDGVILYSNKAANFLLDKIRGDGDKKGGQLLKIIAKALKAGVAISEEAEIDHRIFSFLVVPILDKNYVNFYSRDITDQKKAEGALKKSEYGLEKSQEIAHLGSWELDLLENKLTWSNEVYRIFGLTPQQFGATYEAFLQSVHPDDRKAVDSAYTGSIRDNKDTYEIEHRVVRPDGEIRIVHEKCEHIKDKNGKIIRSMGMVHDITDRRKAEEQLKESEEKFRAVVETAADAIISSDDMGKIIFWNKGAEKIFGYGEKEVLGRSLTVIMPQKYKVAHLGGMERLRVSGKARIMGKTYEVAGLKKSGEEFPISLSISGWGVGGKKFYTAIIRDITAQKKIDKMKSEFISIASHQLKTPLTAIGWIAERLLSGKAGKLSQKQNDYLGDIHNSNARMIKLVDDLLSVSRLEEGRIKIEKKPLQPEDLIKKIIKSHEFLSGKKKCKITFTKLEKKLPFVPIDESLLGQIVGNLLSNAFRYSRNDCNIKIKLEKSGRNLLLSVADSGIGIPKDKQYMIFQKFFRADNAQKMHPDGTGLGLYITKMIVELLGGKIWFESGDGKGTTFYVSLPL